MVLLGSPSRSVNQRQVPDSGSSRFRPELVPSQIRALAVLEDAQHDVAAETVAVLAGDARNGGIRR